MKSKYIDTPALRMHYLEQGEEGGHFFVESRPLETARLLGDFLRGE